MKDFSALLLTLYLVLLAPAMLQAQDTTAVPAPAHQPANGLLGEYYNGTNFENKVYSRIDDVINFSYTRQSPAPGVRGEYYSIRWTGSLYAPVTGTYKLSVRVDDGIRVWLNGVKILDQWKLQETTTYSGQLELKGGKHYPLKIEYYNGPIHGVMQLMWEMPEEEYNLFSFFRNDRTRKPIPNQYLFRKPPTKEPSTAIAGISRQEVVNDSANAVQVRPAQEKTVAKQAPAPQQSAQNTATAAPAVLRNSIHNDETATAQELREEDIFENLKPGTTIPLENVLFEQGKYVLLRESSGALDKLTRTLVKYPHLKIRIEGHTDNVGDPAINHSLSVYRAKAVATYLHEHGIDPLRIEIDGYGSSRPLADNSTEEGRARNRRVQFVVR
ncbi:PA14 domain-containing protein [Cesiribacter sp. SM1]|uniref:PA14 domain-containing protein n=1 Tax=Cesiribacter sp. SM1 TaxID=2861196 RepID=UPI001CD407DC|nr:PA14 domain-containing protein [Cesiribacter sp. SM1]